MSDLRFRAAAFRRWLTLLTVIGGLVTAGTIVYRALQHAVPDSPTVATISLDNLPADGGALVMKMAETAVSRLDQEITPVRFEGSAADLTVRIFNPRYDDSIRESLCIRIQPGRVLLESEVVPDGELGERLSNFARSGEAAGIDAWALLMVDRRTDLAELMGFFQISLDAGLDLFVIVSPDSQDPVTRARQIGRKRAEYRPC